MPRQSRGRSSAPARAPQRPTAAPAPRPAPQQQQTRPASTAAYPPQGQAGHPQAPGVPQTQQASQGPGLFGQMASTAAGVAVGSSIGHAIGGMFGGWGGSSEAPAQQQEQQPTNAYSQPMDSQMYGTSAQSANNYSAESGPCARDIKTFTQCMTENNGNMNICGWYLEQLKACQQAASQY